MKKKPYLWIILSSLILTLVFMFPYLSSELSLEHDTLFHLSRIEGLAHSLANGKLFPDIYPLKNDGFGYASALFYCDLFLVPAALLYNLSAGLGTCYKLTVFLATLLSAVSMSLLIYRLKPSKSVSLLASALYLFSSYRITDVYVRGALGEVIAMAFIPLTVLGAYELLYTEKPENHMLIVGFTGLALSHNLTLLLGCIGFGALLLFNLRKLNRKRLVLLVQAVVISVSLSAFFLFPMLEQTSFQQYYLHYYAANSDLSSHAMASWQYLVNETIFGLSGNTLAYDQAMSVTPGIALLFLPVCSLFCIDRKKDSVNQFISVLGILGILFTLMCSNLFPWGQLFFLRIMQFPWRWMTLATVYLSTVSALAVADAFKQSKTAVIVVFICVMINSIHLLTPCLHRPTVISNDIRYEELLNTIDPYFANTSYNRIEVAGADYLPIGFLDYKNASHCITDLYGNEISCDIQKDDSLTFNAPEHTEIIVPLTAYKGYKVLSENKELEWTTVNGRISFNTAEHTQFTVTYQKTFIQMISIGISLFTLSLITIQTFIKKRSR